MSRYCDMEDLFTVGIHRDVVTEEVARTSVEKVILDASAEMDSYLGQRYVLPIVSLDRSLVAKCAAMAAFYLMQGIGYNPEGEADKIIVNGYERAIEYLEKVVDHRVSPQIIDSSSSPTPGQSSMGGPRVRTGSGRGLSTRQGNLGPGYFIGD
jgi:phage gp36-like protein